MVQFLGVIEKRTNDILQMYNEVFQKNLQEKGSKINEESVISGSLYQINPITNTVELNSLRKNLFT